MHLDPRNPTSVCLELTLSEAFELQNQLTALIRRLTMNLSGGIQTDRAGTGQELFVGSTSEVDLWSRVPGKDAEHPGSLTIMIVKPLK